MQQSDNKPVFAFDRAYTRVGKTTQKLSNSELCNLIKKYELPDIDEQALDGKVKETDIDKELFDKFADNTFKNITNAEYWCFVRKNELFHNVKKSSTF